MLVRRLGLRVSGAAAAFGFHVSIDALEQWSPAVADVVTNDGERAAFAGFRAPLPIRRRRAEAHRAQPRLGRLGRGAAERAESAGAAGQCAHFACYRSGYDNSVIGFARLTVASDSPYRKLLALVGPRG